MNVFEKARIIIEERGWTQEKLAEDPASNTGPVCLLGAMANAVGVPLVQPDVPEIMNYMSIECIPEVQLLHNEIYQMTGILCAPSWNDMPERTEEEVIELLNTMAEKHG